MMFKSAFVAAMAGTALGQTYSTQLAAVVGDTNNIAAFAGATSSTQAAELLATSTSLASAHTEYADATTWIAGLTDAQKTTCEKAYNEEADFWLLSPPSVAELNDHNFMYVYRYIRETDYDNHIAAAKKCIDAVNPSNADQLKTDLDAAKNLLVVYTGKVGLDFTAMTEAANGGANQVITLTAEQKKLYRTTMGIYLQGSCGTEIYQGDLDITTNAQIIAVAANDDKFVTDINALETSWDFASHSDFLTYVYAEDRKDFLVYTNTHKLIVNNEADIYTAYGYSDTTKPTLAQITDAGNDYAECKTRAQAAITANVDSYNSASAMGFSLVMLVALVAALF